MDSLGSSATKQTQAAQNFTNAQDAAIARAIELYKRGPTPNVGIDVVAINDAEKAALQNVNAAANAFGLQGAGTMPFEGMEVIEQGGLRGYSSYPVFLDNMKRLKELRPAQYAEMSKLAGYDMITGEPIAPPAPVITQSASGGGGGNDDDPLERHYQIFPHTRPTSGPYANPASRNVTVTRNDGTRYTSSTPRPILRPGSRGGFSGAEDTVRRVSGGIFGRLTGRG